MKIYWIKAQAPLRVLALVKHLGLEAEFIDIGAKLKTPEYALLNPNKKAPTLVDGELVLWESSAIMAYLCVKAGSDMWPSKNEAEQIEVLRWLGWNDCHWAGAVSPFYFEHIVKATFHFGVPDREALKPKIPELLKYARILNDRLEGQSQVCCGRLTIADFALGSMARYWKEAEMPLQDFPHLLRWLDGLSQIPAWADPWPVPAVARDCVERPA